MIDPEFRERCYLILAENLPMLRGKLRLTQQDLADIEIITDPRYKRYKVKTTVQ